MIIMIQKIIIAWIIFSAVGFGAAMVRNGEVGNPENWGGRLDKNEHYVLNAAGTVTSSDDFELLGSSDKALLIAYGREAILTMSGGTLKVNGKIFIGHDNHGKPGILKLSGGSLSTVGSVEVARNRLNPGDTPVGVLDVSGGTLNVGQHLLIGHPAFSGETARMVYLGGTVSIKDQFQLMEGGSLEFRLGAPAIQCGGMRSGAGTVKLLFDDIYRHTPDAEYILISSKSSSGAFSLETDAGLVTMGNGAKVKVNGYLFSVINTSSELGLVAQ